MFEKLNFYSSNRENLFALGHGAVVELDQVLLKENKVLIGVNLVVKRNGTGGLWEAVMAAQRPTQTVLFIETYGDIEEVKDEVIKFLTYYTPHKYIFYEEGNEIKIRREEGWGDDSVDVLRDLDDLHEEATLNKGYKVFKAEDKNE